MKIVLGKPTYFLLLSQPQPQLSPQKSEIVLTLIAPSAQIAALYILYCLSVLLQLFFSFSLCCLSAYTSTCTFLANLLLCFVSHSYLHFFCACASKIFTVLYRLPLIPLLLFMKICYTVSPLILTRLFVSKHQM